VIVVLLLSASQLSGWMGGLVFSPSITGVSKKSLGKDVAMALSLEWVKTLG